MYNGVCWSSRECAFRGFNCGDAPRGDACESKCGCFSMSLRCRPFTALLVCIGIALPVAALAGAEPDNPFSGLSCSCDEPLPGRHNVDAQRIQQGIRAGLSSRVRPAPMPAVATNSS